MNKQQLIRAIEDLPDTGVTIYGLWVENMPDDSLCGCILSQIAAKEGLGLSIRTSSKEINNALGIPLLLLYNLVEKYDDAMGHSRGGSPSGIIPLKRGKEVMIEVIEEEWEELCQ